MLYIKNVKGFTLMTKEIFIKYIQEQILPLFTGSYIDGEIESSSRDSEVAQGLGGSMLVKPNKEDEYRIVLRRSQPFKNADVELMRVIVEELNKINHYEIEDEVYNQRLQALAMEKAICKSLTDISVDVLLGVIKELDGFARKTYEGQRIRFGIILNEYNSCPNASENIYYKNLFKKDFFAVLSNGMQSCVELDKDGYLLGHVLFEKLKFFPTISHYDYSGVAKYCNDKRVGIILQESGEILLLKNREIMYCKKRGVWCSYYHDEIIQLLSNRTSHTTKDIRKSLYFTALDCSFAGTGGCLVCVNKDRVLDALTHIDINDIIDPNYFELKKKQLLDDSKTLFGIGREKIVEENTTFDEFINTNHLIKSACFKQCIAGRKFHELTRKFRQELTGVDGATIIDYEGNIIAIGAIVQIKAGSTGGGRLAATKELAKYGVAIKISADGIMQAFVKEKKSNDVKQIFTGG